MGIVDNVKEVADLVKKMGDVELYRKIIELEEQVFSLNRTNREQEDEIAALHMRLSFSSSLTYKSPFYYADEDPVPFCPKCWESESKAIHLVGWDRNFECPQCYHYFHKESFGWETGKQAYDRP